MDGNTIPGNLSKAEIIRLHMEQDPASPLYKGPQSTDRGDTNGDTEMPQPLEGYYEPSKHQLEEIAKSTPQSESTTTFTTEEVTRSITRLWPENLNPEEEHNESNP